MASLTITIDPAILEAARHEAERRQTSLDQMVSDYLATVAHTSQRTADAERLIRLMNEGPLGVIDKPLTREEIYAERTRPRS
jgi:vacuolar-type H+-ATPase subunit E/Vma4